MDDKNSSASNLSSPSSPLAPAASPLTTSLPPDDQPSSNKPLFVTEEEAPAAPFSAAAPTNLGNIPSPSMPSPAPTPLIPTSPPPTPFTAASPPPFSANTSRPVKPDASPAPVTPAASGDAKTSLPPVFGTPPKKGGRGKLIAGIVAVMIVIIAIPVGLYLVGQNQELRKKAANHQFEACNPGDYVRDCTSGCTYDVWQCRTDGTGYDGQGQETNCQIAEQNGCQTTGGGGGNAPNCPSNQCYGDGQCIDTGPYGTASGCPSGQERELTRERASNGYCVSPDRETRGCQNTAGTVSCDSNHCSAGGQCYVLETFGTTSNCPANQEREITRSRNNDGSCSENETRSCQSTGGGTGGTGGTCDKNAELANAGGLVTLNYSGGSGQSLADQSCDTIATFVAEHQSKAGSRWALESACGSSIPGTADGQSLATQSTSIIQNFISAHGAQACTEWVTQHASAGGSCIAAISWSGVDSSWNRAGPVTNCAPVSGPVSLTMRVTLPSGCPSQTVTWKETQANCPGSSFAMCPGSAACSSTPTSQSGTVSGSTPLVKTITSQAITCGSYQVDFDNININGTQTNFAEGIRTYMDTCAGGQAGQCAAIKIYKYPYNANNEVARPFNGKLAAGDPIKMCLSFSGGGTPMIYLNNEATGRVAQLDGPGGTKCLQWDIPNDATSFRVLGRIE